MSDNLTLIANWLNETAAVYQQSAKALPQSIAAAADLATASLKNGGKLIMCGNGGSAADAQHFAAEFVCRLSSTFDRPPLAALALTTDTSFLTAHANDFGVENIYARQLEALGKPEDLLFLMSTSGTSPNIIAAAEKARMKKIKTVAITGPTGTLREVCDVAIEVPTSHGQHMQEVHLAVEHLICHIVERAMFPR